MSEHRANETVTENTGTEREATSEAGERDPGAPRPVTEAAERVATAAVDLGRLWARHGLTLGRLALETSAEALRTTAGLLEAVEGAFAPPKKAEG